jgi:transcriptional regulator with XRE-family HTH domain
MELGITLAELAARLDVSVGHLSSLEHGRRTRPSAESVRRIARAYGLREALFQSEIGGGGDRAAAAAWLRGRAEWHRNRAAELDRAAAELEGEGRAPAGQERDDHGPGALPCAAPASA